MDRTQQRRKDQFYILKAKAGRLEEEVERLKAEHQAEVGRLRKIIDVVTGPPMTAEEAEAALDDLPELDQAEQDARAAIDIEKIIAYATDPANMSPEEALRRMIEAARKSSGFDGKALREAEACLEKRWLI